MSEEPKEEKKEEDFKSKWDTEKQRADQERANYEKVVAENEAITEQLGATDLKVEELERQLSAKQEKADEIEFDSDFVDKNVIKAITKLKSDLNEAKSELESLKGKATTYEEREQKKAAEQAQQQAIDKTLSPLDEEFGAKHRNAAYKLAEKLIAERKEKKPDDQIDAYLLMRKCYKQVKEEDKPEDAVRTDTGAGGIPGPSGGGKKGTLDEVLSDMKSNKSWKE